MKKSMPPCFLPIFQFFSMVLLSLTVLFSPVVIPQAQAEPTAISQSYDDKQVDKLILNSPVVDEMNVLTAEEKQQLITKLKSLYQRGLAQAGLVIIPSTNGQDIFNYSMQLAERWELGNKDTDDGLLIVVAVDDRDMYILTGYGLESVFPDGAVGRIIRNDITPSFKEGNYGEGLIAGVNRIEERLTADPQVIAQADKLAREREQSSQSEGGLTGTPIAFFIVCMVFGNLITGIFGRVIGSLLLSIGFFAISALVSGSFILPLVLAIFLWFILMNEGGGRGGGSSGGFGGFSTGGGGFGSSGGGSFGGGFSGGGGGFGGGGAGGSW